MKKTKLNIAMNRFLRRIHVRRNYKDRLFQKCFEDKGDLLTLYNAINHTNYDNEDDLEITTLDDFIYMSMKNDLSFIISSNLNLYEQQSTYNPNMPLRGFLYFAEMYQAYIEKENLKKKIYKSTLVKLPKPTYIVFYNGSEEQPDRKELRLSEAFANERTEETEPALECVATMININYGHNEELLEQCKRLSDYSKFVHLVNQNLKEGFQLEDAIDTTIQYCKEQDILTDILAKHESEVYHMLFKEFNEKEYKKEMEAELKELKKEKEAELKELEKEKEAELKELKKEKETELKELKQEKDEVIQKQNIALQEKNEEIERLKKLLEEKR